MRKTGNHHLCTLICALVLGLCFTACEEDSDYPAYYIHGYWKIISSEYHEYVNGELYDEGYENAPSILGSTMGLRFDKDGCYYAWVDVAGFTFSEYGGTYSYSNGELEMTSETEDGVKETTVTKVEELTNRKLIIVYTEEYIENGDRHRYVERTTLHRVQKELARR